MPGPDGERETPIYLDYNATTPLDPAVANSLMRRMLRAMPSLGYVVVGGTGV